MSAKADDAEEKPSGWVSTTDGGLEPGHDGANRQTVGLRFRNLSVPAGATITPAYVQFTADEVRTGTARLTVAGQAANNAPASTTASENIADGREPEGGAPHSGPVRRAARGVHRLT